MPAPWLHIIGIGESGLDGVLPVSRAILQAADVIIGGARHHALVQDVPARRITWPSPFDALRDTLCELRGQNVVVLATGDPLWFSVGCKISTFIEPSEIIFHPQLSAFQLAAARMGWSLDQVETLSVHGRPTEQIIAYIQPAQKLLVLSAGAQTPPQIAALLTKQGFGASKLTVLSHMGGNKEARFEGHANSWQHDDVPDFHTLAIECIALSDAVILPRVGGLEDDFFSHDGCITKREVRAVTLAKLMPMRDALLWDIGAGCGSVSIEWMRHAVGAQAIAIEPRADRCAAISANAFALGAPKLQIIPTAALEALADLPAPDAVFIGGGLSADVFERAWAALRPFGRLVVNAVTLESSYILGDLHRAYGGDLVQLSVARSNKVGNYRGWRPLMPVTQWSLIKR